MEKDWSLCSEIEETTSGSWRRNSGVSDTEEFISSEFGIKDLSSVPFERVTRAQALQKTEELDEALGALGSVNLKAEEELREVSDRIELIAAGRADVEEAIREIHRARETVEKEIEKRFLETFSLVREFVKYCAFPRGRPTPPDEETWGEVAAEPPGRRQNT